MENENMNLPLMAQLNEEKMGAIRRKTIEEVNAREEEAVSLNRDLNVVETVLAIRDSGEALVHLPTIENPEGILIGKVGGVSKEDIEMGKEALINNLRRHAPSGLAHTAQVLEALESMRTTEFMADRVSTGAQMEKATIQRSITIRGVEFVILGTSEGGTIVRTADSYELVTEFDTSMNGALADELIGYRCEKYLDALAEENEEE